MQSDGDADLSILSILLLPQSGRSRQEECSFPFPINLIFRFFQFVNLISAVQEGRSCFREEHRIGPQLAGEKHGGWKAGFSASPHAPSITLTTHELSISLNILSPAAPRGKKEKDYGKKKTRFTVVRHYYSPRERTRRMLSTRETIPVLLERNIATCNRVEHGASSRSDRTGGTAH